VVGKLQLLLSDFQLVSMMLQIRRSVPQETALRYLSRAMPDAGVGSNLLAGVPLPRDNFFTPQCFHRGDESDDSGFYKQPRFVTHIDDGAIGALTRHYEAVLPSKATAHLDVCSSWVSFLPDSYRPPRCVGLGMNQAELDRNQQLTETVVQDLNKNPKLPFEDESFDAVTNVVSIDYMTNPLELLAEYRRVLRPGGIAVHSFSNRMFWTKAVAIWTAGDEWQRVLIASAYFSIAGFDQVEAFMVRSPKDGDPLYVVQARKGAKSEL